MILHGDMEVGYSLWGLWTSVLIIEVSILQDNFIKYHYYYYVLSHLTLLALLGPTVVDGSVGVMSVK